MAAIFVFMHCNCNKHSNWLSLPHPQLYMKAQFRLVGGSGKFKMVGWTNLWKIEEMILKCGRIKIDNSRKSELA